VAGAEINFDPYIDALLVLGTAGVVVPLVRRTGASPVLGYLAAGALIGPLGLGSLKYEWPLLQRLTIQDAENVAGIAELGVIFLLFLIGLELSFERLATMRRLVFGLGGLQVAITAGVLSGIILVIGLDPAAAVILGFALALSSTAIVLEVLSQRKRLATMAGRASFSVLLAQDLAVVPLFLLIAVLGASESGGVLAGLGAALLQATLALLVIVVAGRLLLRPLFRLVAAAHSSELFIAATLLVIVGAGVVAGLAGLSMALGAFVAGLMLAETEFRKSIETIIEPFKALLLGVFFFTIGMKIDVRQIIAHPVLIGLAVVSLITVKTVIVMGLMQLFRLPRAVALEAGPMLGPGGEFAFVGIGLAMAAGVVGWREAGFALAVTSLSMALIPTLHQLGRRVSGYGIERRHFEAPVAPESEEGHTIVIGHGRVGRTVAEMLERHGKPYLATDSDSSTVAMERARGRPVFFGNATSAGYLHHCGLDSAKAVVITIHDRQATDEIVRMVRAERPDVTIVARAKDADHARHLYAIGVTDAVPETIEASLQLSEAVLVGIGIAAGPVIASIHEKRDEFRHELQEAAAKEGGVDTRAVRPRSTSRPSP
jgi:CPA2 family monovalent cation:H+ antiporter-2